MTRKEAEQLKQNGYKQGVFFIYDSLLLYPGATFAEFMETSLYKNQNDAFMMREMPRIQMWGHSFAVSIWYRNKNLYLLTLCCTDPECCGLNENEMQKIHETILREQGLDADNQYDWGSIRVNTDPKSGFNEICIFWKSHITKNEALRIISEEGLDVTTFNLNEDHYNKPDELVLKKKGGHWVTFWTSERAGAILGSEVEFETESDALENMIRRLRLSKKLYESKTRRKEEEQKKRQEREDRKLYRKIARLFGRKN